MSITDDSFQVYRELNRLLPFVCQLLTDLERNIQSQRLIHHELKKGLQDAVPALHHIRQALLEAEDWELYVLMHTAWVRVHNIVSWLERTISGAQLEHDALVEDVQALHLALEQAREMLLQRE
jgi:hypothetical protein